MDLWMASLHGAPALALEVERLGICCSPDERLEHAQGPRPVLLNAGERVRSGERSD